jgi:Ca2+/Na+ antiporter
VLALILYDAKVTWEESLVLVLLYPCYILFMYFSPSIEMKLYEHLDDKKNMNLRFPEKTVHIKAWVAIPEEAREDLEGDIEKDIHETDGGSESQEKESYDSSETTGGHLDPPEGVFDIPDEIFPKIAWAILLPINVTFSLTIPRTTSDCCRRSIIVTFIVSILWIGLLTYVLVWMVTIIGDTLEIPDSIMGLTLVCFGSSVPDTIGCIIIARQGLGDMAVGTLIGSNVFDIVLCLGLPWTVKTLIYEHDSEIQIKSTRLFLSCFVLFGLLMISFALFVVRKFQLDKVLGSLLLLMYAIFLPTSIAVELLKPAVS